MQPVWPLQHHFCRSLAAKKPQTTTAMNPLKTHYL